MRNLLLFSVLFLSFYTANSQKRQATGQEKMTMNPNSGYANVTEFTYGYGLKGTTTLYSTYFYGFTSSHGYQLNIYGLNVRNHLFLGAGTGLLFYKEGNLVPAYIDMRFAWTKKRIEPFIVGTSGALFGFKNIDENTKIFLTGGGGVRYRLDDSFALSLGAGLFVQMGNSRATFINLRFGISYKSNKY